MRPDPRADSHPPQRMALFRALYLGDMLLAIPALRSLRLAFPQTEMTLIGLPWARDFVARYNYIDRFLDFPGFPGLSEYSVDNARLRSFFQQTRAYQFDLAIQMHGNGSVSNRFVAGLGAKQTIGFAPTVVKDPLLDQSIPFDDREHEISKWLRLAHQAGAHRDDRALEFPLRVGDTVELAKLTKLLDIPTGDSLIVLHAGAKHRSKLWPMERWARVVEALTEEGAFPIVLTGNADELPLALEIMKYTDGPLINAVGKTSLGTLAALAARAALFIGADSGPAHLAEAVGTNTVRLFGPTDPNRWGALDRQHHIVLTRKADCAPCSFTVCPIDHRCMNDIRVDAVIEASLRLLHQPVIHP